MLCKSRIVPITRGNRVRKSRVIRITPSKRDVLIDRANHVNQGSIFPEPSVLI